MDMASAMLFGAAQFREPWPPLWLLETGGQVLLLVWLFSVGASIGSFLNVVVYRLPLGLNLVHPGSHCPRCLAPIRWRHNIPVFGWLILRGKCYDCKLPISPRYPLIELLIGSLFAGIAWLELFRWHSFEVPTLIAFARPHLHPSQPWPFWFAYATHVVLLTTLIGAALLEFDRRRVPWRLYLPVLLLGFFAPRFWPGIRHVPWSDSHMTAAWEAWLADGVAGLATGLLLGLAIGWLWWLAQAGEDWPRFSPACLFATVGTVVGWQQVSVAIVPALLVWLAIIAVQRLAHARFVVPLTGLVAIAVVPALLASDRGLAPLLYLTSVAHLAWMLSTLAAAAFFAFLAGAIAPPQYLSSASPAVTAADTNPREAHES
jgi:leader peptidase (prepilin peptidase)/N-methyltransferase